MNRKLRDIIAYFIENYPYKDELSKTRLTKMVYLADWFSVSRTGRPITGIEWYFDHYGPYVDSVFEFALFHSDFEVVSTQSVFGSKKQLIKKSEGSTSNVYERLSENDLEVLAHVISETEHLMWNDFIRYVYNTPPVKEGVRYQKLDLSIK